MPSTSSIPVMSWLAPLWNICKLKMRINLSSPDVGEAERAALLRAFDSGWIAPAGPEIAAFESELANYTNAGAVVALSSGTAALHLALKVVGVEADDEVWASTFTFAATANAITYCGARPTFVDSEPHTWNMCPQLLADALRDARRKNRLPRAVVVVDLYGQCANYSDIIPMCRELGIAVIEDAAEAVGSRYLGQAAGTLADAGVFSFNGNKIMTTSGGGAFLHASTEVAERVRYLSTQAREPVHHYEHREIGYNYRLSNLLAALGRAQLSRLDDMIARRRRINATYRALLSDLPAINFAPEVSDTFWNGWLTCVLFKSQEVKQQVAKNLISHDIECRPLWKPMHQQPVFAKVNSWLNGVSENLFLNGLCLPSGSSISESQVHEIAERIRASITSSEDLLDE